MNTRINYLYRDRDNYKVHGMETTVPALPFLALSMSGSCLSDRLRSRRQSKSKRKSAWRAEED